MRVCGVSKREFLIESFLSLASQNGVAATGVDTIAAYAGVSKKTIYNQFGNKEALAIEALRKLSSDIQTSWQQEWDHISDPEELLLASFTALKILVTKGEFHGCMFINICKEYPESDHELHRIASQHKQDSLDELRKRIAHLGERRDADAMHIELLYEGLISKLLVNQDVAFVDQTKAIVLTILTP